MTNVENILVALLATAFGRAEACVSVESDIDWQRVYEIANQQGVSAICLDGLQHLDMINAVPLPIKMQWIASAVRQEQIYNAQWEAAVSLSQIWHDAGMCTYVMKGFALANMYPSPMKRYSCDMDCFMVGEHGWCGETANSIVEEAGIRVDRSYYKNSKFCFHGLTVENHRYLLPIKGSKKAKKLEKILRSQIETGEAVYIGDSYLQIPSERFNSIYILAHAQEHFLEGGIALKHICDWAMVLKTYADNVDWNEWKYVCQEYGMLSFGYAMSRLANRVCGIDIPFECTKDDEADRRLLDDTLYRKIENRAFRSGMQVRVELVKTMFRNGWKYRMFSDTNFLMFGARRIWGYLFDKDLD